MKLICTVLFTFSFAAVGHAEPIKFIHEASGSGTLGGIPFSNIPFVIIARGDTNDRQHPFGDIYYIEHQSAEISLLGIGTFEITLPLNTFVNQHLQVAGFERPMGSTLFNGPANPAYSSWNMLTSIGPYTGPGRLSWWAFEEPVTTDAGVLIFLSAEVQSATFTAIVLIPEPSSILLAAGSLLLLAFRRQS